MMLRNDLRAIKLVRHLVGGTAALLSTMVVASGQAEAASKAAFPLSRTGGLPATCAARATGAVKIVSQGFAEKMTVTVRGLRPGTELDLFTLQVPGFPFGVGWYVGDLTVGASGSVTKTFIGRFSVETFALAIGTANAPQPHHGDDAARNPTFKPIHTHHLGIWFNSPADAVANGCSNFETPFNGEHNAGIQVLNTSSFADLNGPLNKID